MTQSFQQHLGEQEKRLNGILGEVPEVLEQFKGMTCPICGQPSDKSPQMQELKDFLRQSNIETVKWVIKFIYKTTPEDSIETQRLDKNLLDDKYFIAGHDAAINDLVCELNKSIEDHERE